MPTQDVVRDAVLIMVLLVAVAVLLLAVRSRRRGSPAADRPEPRRPPPQAAVVVHAVKVDDQDTRRQQIEQAAALAGWAPPIWLDTTELDPGRGQAAAAVAAAPDAVLSFGGDGTARLVADALAGTGIPLGLLPAGTGNLLARNLGIPPSRLDAALQVALTGADRMIDIGRAEVWRTGEPGEPPASEPFLVMAGLGFDAEVMTFVDPALKQALGWWAYVVAGLRRLHGRRVPVTLQVDGGRPRQLRVRAVVVGNCGMLQGGIQLLPEALVDDGWLDVVIVSPESLLGWLAVTARVITGRGRGVVEHLRCRSLEIRAERPMHVQFDGDAAGTVRVLRATVDHQAVLIRVPE